MKWLDWMLGKDARARHEIDEELATHLALRTQDNLATGMSPEQAEANARERFGDADGAARACERARRPRGRIGVICAGLAGMATVAAIVVVIAGPSTPVLAEVSWARVAPFDGIRWDAERPEVRVGEHWFELVSIDGIGVPALLKASRDEYGDRWLKRFEEDIVEVIEAAGGDPGRTVTLGLREVATGRALELRDVEMTHEKRQTLMRSLDRQGGRGMPTLAPFDSIEWQDELPRVRVNGQWVTLLAIDGRAVGEIVAFARATYPDTRNTARPLWQKRFEEDLVEVLTRMDQEPGLTVSLRVRDEAGAQTTLENVAMTGENRRDLWKAAMKREAR